MKRFFAILPLIAALALAGQAYAADLFLPMERPIDLSPSRRTGMASINQPPSAMVLLQIHNGQSVERDPSQFSPMEQARFGGDSRTFAIENVSVSDALNAMGAAFDLQVRTDSLSGISARRQVLSGSFDTIARNADFSRDITWARLGDTVYATRRGNETIEVYDVSSANGRGVRTLLQQQNITLSADDAIGLSRDGRLVRVVAPVGFQNAFRDLIEREYRGSDESTRIVRGGIIE